MPGTSRVLQLLQGLGGAEPLPAPRCPEAPGRSLVRPSRRIPRGNSRGRRLPSAEPALLTGGWIIKCALCTVLLSVIADSV